MTYYIANSGKRINIETITEQDICLQDIAHHLTKICRYGGALDLNKHYSVANHSIALYYYALENNYPIEVQRGVLMHDASEAYLGDVVAGLKKLLPDYKRIELSVEGLIAEKYGLCLAPHITDIVKELDTRILLDEALAFMPQHYESFDAQLNGFKPLGIKLYSEHHLATTKSMFLHCCDMLDIYD